MMQLILRNEDQERQIDLPLEVLTALWGNETQIVLACIGWAENGFLVAATPPHRVERGEGDGDTDAGQLNVRLSVNVQASVATLDEKFIPYGVRLEKQRIRQAAIAKAQGEQCAP